LFLKGKITGVAASDSDDSHSNKPPWPQQRGEKQNLPYEAVKIMRNDKENDPSPQTFAVL
jgi:hypothetical protein